MTDLTDGSFTPFWIDTEGYSDRDRLMFMAGCEFEAMRQCMKNKCAGTLNIHRENESRMRMLAARMGYQCVISQYTADGWEHLSLITFAPRNV